MTSHTVYVGLCLLILGMAFGVEEERYDQDLRGPVYMERRLATFRGEPVRFGKRAPLREPIRFGKRGSLQPQRREEMLAALGGSAF